MRGRLVSAIAATTLLTAAAVPSGCGYFLYPERRGNSGGSIDGATLVMDLLWLIPGVVPGVIALIVDFSSGAVYTRGERHAVVMSPKGRVAVRLPASTQPMQVEARLVSFDRQVLARKITFVGPDVPAQSLELQVTDWMQYPRDSEIYLEVSTANGTARFPTAMQVSR